MNNIQNQKPCVVETPQGFSVSYKERFLYSKYNPSKTIINTIQNLSLLPNTVFLCISPVLPHGVNELISKLPESCLIVFVELDNNLYKLSKEKLSAYLNNENVIYPTPDELLNLPILLFNKNTKGQYKRVVRIDFSAGVQFNQPFYDELTSVCTNNIMTFWKNRITLTKFGRKYSHNFFTNLSLLSKSLPITNFFNAIEKPILVFGAGQSLDTFLEHNKLDFSKFYILCVDTALQPLLKRKIIPDGVFIEEAQNVISKAFIGCLNNNVHLFAGLSSLPAIPRLRKEKTFSFFTTEYANTEFLSELKSSSFLPPVNKPYGSVGITTVYYALKFRKDNSIPVYVTGLDFSYSVGLTHGKETLANNQRLSSANRLSPANNYTAAFGSSAVKIKDKKQNIFITTPSLQSYANIFDNLFAGTSNLFDASESGIKLSIESGTPANPTCANDNRIKTDNYTASQIEELNTYLLREKQDLEHLKALLTGKEKLPEYELQNEIKKIAERKDYLYLHFPDGYCFNYSQSFLNRIRTEIDYFIHRHFL